ncbi:hypothetical protein [Marinoscillum furvescens]|uniref:Uncharacterized protein n=1 Tax=Marinoscillum furvescens DSM 4134 TaxID=1122208 RepID=A0A3D9L503_MARFU|nr:hypothetical protein [Marinoscillum furvescens]REE01103.1 hypothetical protein C7460_104123 [Marinoscillum furvescens DSM 4134]
MELTEINLETINDADELIGIASHCVKVMNKVDNAVNAYGGFNSFPYLNAELKDDGLVHLTLSKDPDEPVFTLSPGDFNNMMSHLRDTYFPGVKAFAENMRNEAIAKTDEIVNPPA